MGDKNKEKMDTARLEQSLRRREKAVKLPAKYKDLSPTSVKAELKTLREEVSAAAAALTPKQQDIRALERRLVELKADCPHAELEKVSGNAYRCKASDCQVVVHGIHFPGS